MTPNLLLIVAAVVLVVFAMALVALEQAITRISRSHATELAATGVRGSRQLLVVSANRARYLNVVLFVRLAATTFAVVFVTVACLALFPAPQWLGIVVAGVGMLIVGYIALGVTPRTLGQQHADFFALNGAGLTRFLGVVLSPLAALMIIIGNALTPGKGYRQGPFATQAEFLEMLDLAGVDQVIADEERAMIHSVFELGDTLARSVMVPRTEMVWIEKDKRLRQGLSLALRSGFSRIPVIGENLDDIVGFVYLKDVAQRLFEHADAGQSERVESIMRPVIFVPDSKLADDLLKEMQAEHVHVAIVVDEYGGTAGLVTIEDILEEIVGEIADEYDGAEIPESEALTPGCWRVSSRMQLDDFAELTGLDVSLDTKGVETVGGLLARRLGVVPIPGSYIDIDGHRMVAELAAGRRNRLGTVLVSPLVDSTGANHDPGQEADSDQ